MKFTHRRIRNFIILAIVAYLVFFALKVIEYSLNIQQFYSGWLMVFLIFMLLLFYIKKRLIVVPLGRNAGWAQWHYYSGLLLLVVFVKHIDFNIPDGTVEMSLFISLMVVILSGAGGALFNRIYAKRLGSLDDEVIFERIVQHRETLRSEVESLLLDVVDETNSDTLSNYYLKHLSRYFERPRHVFSHLIGSNYATLKILNGLERQMRYLNSAEAECAFALRERIRQKDILDRHFALQGFLKYWGVLHFPVALCMVCLIVLHVVLVYSFNGGL